MGHGKPGDVSIQPAWEPPGGVGAFSRGAVHRPLSVPFQELSLLLLILGVSSG